jgi:DNA-binding response OmpR family regulator
MSGKNSLDHSDRQTSGPSHDGALDTALEKPDQHSLDPLKALRNSSLLIVGKESSDRLMVSQHFEGLNCQIEMMESSNNALAAVGKNSSYNAIILIVEQSLSEVLPVVGQIDKVTQSTMPIFLFSKQIEVDVDIDEAFFRGAEAIFFQPLKSDELLRSISFSLQMKSDHPDRQHRRRRVRRAKVEFLNDTTGLVSSGYVMNISQGGMYVCSLFNHPSKFHGITFRISAADEDGKEILGRGIVRWLRGAPDLGRPPGFGVEFKELDGDSREEIAALTKDF